MKIGVVGGTFDPVHIAHLVIAEESFSQFGLDEVLFIPSARPPHKQDVEYARADLRLRMVELATGGDERFTPSGLELERKGLSYTVDTLRQLKGVYGGETELFLIVGADALLDMPNWRAPASILAECRILAAARCGFSLDKLDEILPRVTEDGDPAMSRIMTVNTPLLDISATDIRIRVREGRPYRYLVPGPVWKLIEQKRLYR